MARLSSLALFPLSDVVLLPDVSVPLYIFEPRYRQMTRAALDGTCEIGMVAVRPEATNAMAGDPPIFDVGCRGRIAHAQERPDGTFQILLVGDRRFLIVAEDDRPAEQLYRSAEVELLEDHLPETHAEIEAMKDASNTLLELVERLVKSIGAAEDPARVMNALQGLEPTRLVNSLSQSISFNPIERQQLLESDSIAKRCETLSDLLRFRLAAGGTVDPTSGVLPN